MGSPAGGYDPHARLQVMDEEGIDPVGAVEEGIRAREDGCVGVYLSPDMAARSGKQFTDPDFVLFWNTVQDLEMPIGFHVIVRDESAFYEFSGSGRDAALFFFAFLAIDVMAAFTQMLSSDMFEKYPRLKCAVLEAGGNWIAAWLDRLDHKYEVMRNGVPFSMNPSDYFYRQCLISVDPDETMTAQVVEHMGADCVIWASDYPHIDESMGVVKEIKTRLSTLPEESQQKVLGGNMMRFYNLT